MLRAPEPIGPLTSLLVGHLAGEALDHEHAITDVSGTDPLANRDLQMALFVANALHYGGVEGVPDEFEWDPGVTDLRRELGDAMISRLLEICADRERANPESIPERIFALIEADDAPPLSRFLEGRADLDQFREFVMHRSAYQLMEADPHTFAIPRIHGVAKSAMVEIQADEYGGGDPARMHSSLFARTMNALGLSPRYGEYVPLLPAWTLATVNLITVFSMRRRWRGALVGHLAGFEITSPVPNRRYAKGLRRLGFGVEATEFFDEHVEADSVHENIAAYDLAGRLAAEEPALADDILFGVRALLHVEGRFAAHILDSWAAGHSSLEESQLALAR